MTEAQRTGFRFAGMTVGGNRIYRTAVLQIKAQPSIRQGCFTDLQRTAFQEHAPGTFAGLSQIGVITDSESHQRRAGKTDRRRRYEQEIDKAMPASLPPEIHRCVA